MLTLYLHGCCSGLRLNDGFDIKRFKKLVGFGGKSDFLFLLKTYILGLTSAKFYYTKVGLKGSK